MLKTQVVALKQLVNEQIDEYFEESVHQGFEFEGKSEKEILPDLSLWLYVINDDDWPWPATIQEKWKAFQNKHLKEMDAKMGITS